MEPGDRSTICCGYRPRSHPCPRRAARLRCEEVPCSKDGCVQAFSEKAIRAHQAPPHTAAHRLLPGMGDASAKDIGKLERRTRQHTAAHTLWASTVRCCPASSQNVAARKLLASERQAQQPIAARSCEPTWHLKKTHYCTPSSTARCCRERLAEARQTQQLIAAISS